MDASLLPVFDVEGIDAALGDGDGPREPAAVPLSDAAAPLLGYGMPAQLHT